MVPWWIARNLTKQGWPGNSSVCLLALYTLIALLDKTSVNLIRCSSCKRSLHVFSALRLRGQIKPIILNKFRGAWLWRLFKSLGMLTYDLMGELNARTAQVRPYFIESVWRVTAHLKEWKSRLLFNKQMQWIQRGINSIGEFHEPKSIVSNWFQRRGTVIITGSLSPCMQFHQMTK